MNGKDVTFKGFQFVHSDCFVRGMATKRSLEQYFDRKGFNISQSSFSNAEMTGLDVALDENWNFAGFNNWGHCAFVSSGYIMPYFLMKGEYLTPPLHRIFPESFVTPLLHLAGGVQAVGLSRRGLPDNFDAFMQILSDYRAETKMNEGSGRKAERWMWPDLP